VGFIRALPKELRQAFMATLEELSEADLLLHVVDAAHPEARMHADSVNDILEDLDLRETPRILVLNKWDLVPQERKEEVRMEFPAGISVSAMNQETLPALTRAVIAALDQARPVNG
jgi:GTP-binding protein HflX